MGTPHQIVLKGVVVSYQAALSYEFTPLEGSYAVLTLTRGGAVHNKMVFEDQSQRRCRKVPFFTLKRRGYFAQERRIDGGGTYQKEQKYHVYR